MEEIVKALNNYVQNNFGVKGSFVGHQSYTIDKNFKGFKHNRLCLYYVNNSKDNLIIEEYITTKDSENSNVDKWLRIKFLEAVYDYVASDEFRDLMNGTINI